MTDNPNSNNVDNDSTSDMSKNAQNSSKNKTESKNKTDKTAKKATDMLKQDHQEVKNLFKQYESAGDQALVHKTQLFAKIKKALDVHTQLEEEIFYPAVKTREGEKIRLAFEEHHVVDGLLSELATMQVDKQFDAKMQVLRESVMHHIKEEEGELFPAVIKNFSEEKLKELGAQMEEMRLRLESVAVDEYRDEVLTI